MGIIKALMVILCVLRCVDRCVMEEEKRSKFTSLTDWYCAILRHGVNGGSNMDSILEVVRK